jgi:hypothetical protein
LAGGEEVVVGAGSGARVTGGRGATAGAGSGAGVDDGAGAADVISTGAAAGAWDGLTTFEGRCSCWRDRLTVTRGSDDIHA